MRLNQNYQSGLRGLLLKFNLGRISLKLTQLLTEISSSKGCWTEASVPNLPWQKPSWVLVIWAFKKTATCFIKMCKKVYKKVTEACYQDGSHSFHNLTPRKWCPINLAASTVVRVPHFTNLQRERMLQGHEQETVGIMGIRVVWRQTCSTYWSLCICFSCSLSHLQCSWRERAHSMLSGKGIRTLLLRCL